MIEPNPLIELWPDAVYSLGNERMNKEYLNLLNSNAKRLKTKMDILQFLLNAAMGQHVKQSMHLQHREDLSYLLG